MATLVDEARRDGTLAPDVDPSVVLFFVRILSLGLLLQRGAGGPAPDPQAWSDFVARIVASFGDPTAPRPRPTQEDDR
jgi:hypothetical protein